MLRLEPAAPQSQVEHSTTEPPTGPHSAFGNMSGYRMSDVCLTAETGVASLIPTRSHTAWRLIMK